jgi:hypothetical protein
MHSQLLQWQAFGHAILGDKKEALSCISQSIQLMSEPDGTDAAAARLHAMCTIRSW